MNSMVHELQRKESYGANATWSHPYPVLLGAHAANIYLVM